MATSAEEVKNPKRDLPLGILGALSLVTLCYILMSLVLVMMVPLEALQTSGSFAAAFVYVGLHWAQYIVALGECCGCVLRLAPLNSMLVASAWFVRLVVASEST